MPLKTMVLRAAKGSPLTNAEMDGNLQTVLDFMNGVLLPETAHDLDDYDTPGVYGQNSIAGAEAGFNYPLDPGTNTPVAGLLVVRKGLNGSNLEAQQEFRSYQVGDPTVFYRNKAEGEWGDWVRVSKFSETMSHSVLTTATDANDLTVDNTWYSWVDEDVWNSNFPPHPAPVPGFIQPYVLSSTEVVQIATLNASGAGRAVVYQRQGNGSPLAWTGWRLMSPLSLESQLPTANAGDAYVDGIGWFTWDTSGYVPPAPPASGPAVGTPNWWPLRTSIPAGQIPMDGQTVSRATYPDLAAMVVAGTLPVVAESTWQSDPTQRGKYTLGDGSTTIRVPDMNGKAAGSLGAVFLRGDGTRSAGTNGVLQADIVGPHSHTTTMAFVAGNASVWAAGNGASATYTIANGAGIGTETRPLNATGVWTVHAFGAVVNPGSVNAAQLASDLATTQAELVLVRAGAFGIDQSVQDVLSSRASGTVYTNSTGKPITIYVGVQTSAVNQYMTIRLNGSAGISITTPISGTVAAQSMIIPSGATYEVLIPAGASIISWREYR